MSLFDAVTGEIIYRPRFNFFRPHRRVTLDFDATAVPSMTRQEFKEECDINELMRRYKTSGIPLPQRPPQFLDVTEVPSLMEARNIIIAAETAFMSLSAEVRETFGNDPARFVAFAQDPENLDQMRKWNLAPPPKAAEEPLSVRVVDPTPVPDSGPPGPA